MVLLFLYVSVRAIVSGVVSVVDMVSRQWYIVC